MTTRMMPIVHKMPTSKIKPRMSKMRPSVTNGSSSYVPAPASGSSVDNASFACGSSLRRTADATWWPQDPRSERLETAARQHGVSLEP